MKEVILVYHYRKHFGNRDKTIAVYGKQERNTREIGKRFVELVWLKKNKYSMLVLIRIGMREQGQLPIFALTFT